MTNAERVLRGVVKIQCELVQLARLDCPDSLVRDGIKHCTKAANAIHNRLLDLFYKEFEDAD